jgi:hypothetical protein
MFRVFFSSKSTPSETNLEKLSTKSRVLLILQSGAEGVTGSEASPGAESSGDMLCDIFFLSEITFRAPTLKFKRLETGYPLISKLIIG